MSLIFDCTVGNTPFTLVKPDGERVELFVTKLNVGDTIAIQQWYKGLLDRGEEGKSDYYQLPLLKVTRAIKTASGEHYWKTIDDLADIPVDMINALTVEVDKLNPIGDTSLAEKKSKS